MEVTSKLRNYYYNYYYRITNSQATFASMIRFLSKIDDHGSYFKVSSHAFSRLFLNACPIRGYVHRSWPCLSIVVCTLVLVAADTKPLRVGEVFEAFDPFCRSPLHLFDQIDVFLLIGRETILGKRTRYVVEQTRYIVFWTAWNQDGWSFFVCLLSSLSCLCGLQTSNSIITGRLRRCLRVRFNFILLLSGG